jgi:hypothetical protein
MDAITHNIQQFSLECMLAAMVALFTCFLSSTEGSTNNITKLATL